MDNDDQIENTDNETRKIRWGWVPLLLIPVAFLGGWWVRDLSTNNGISTQSFQPGVGGGPPTSTPSSAPTIIPSVSPTVTNPRNSNGIIPTVGNDGLIY